MIDYYEFYGPLPAKSFAFRRARHNGSEAAFGRGASEFMWYVYVLYSKTSDKFYTGVTSDLRRRIIEHRSGHTKTTDRMGEFELVYYEASKSKKDAAARERQLKTGFGRGYLNRRLKDYFTDK